jgi:hypothetical protein
VADKPDGPRGHPTLSEALKKDINNLMILCDAHHRLVDKVDVAGHPVDRLQSMKRRHEDRIELLTSIAENQQSHILLYGAKIGHQDSHLSFQKSAAAMAPAYYPASPKAIEIGLKGSAFADSESGFWEMELVQLRRQFATLVKPQFAAGEIRHLSVFGLAPIPLLIELGRLLSDISAANVFQLHREPPDWKWRPEPEGFQYTIAPPSDAVGKKVALSMALSADIVPQRIHAILGQDTAIWTLTHAKPGNDFLQAPEQLRALRRSRFSGHRNWTRLDVQS